MNKPQERGVRPWVLEVGSFGWLSLASATVNHVPLTFPAHQAAVLPLKLWRPRWFDGTALVVGSGAPDLFNAFAAIDTFDSHRWDGIAIAVPFSIIYAIVLRRFAADGLFGSVPDLGPLKAHSYRVLAKGRPRFLVTAMSAFLGVASHVIVDSFTHANRLGTNILGLNRVLFDGPMGPVTAAKFLQYIGHTFGSLVGILLLVMAVSSRHLGEWYGRSAVADARRAPLRDGAQVRAFMILSSGILAGSVWGISEGRFPIFHVGLTTVMSFLVIGIVNRPSRTILQTCPDISMPHATTSSTPSTERSPKTSHRSAT